MQAAYQALFAQLFARLDAAAVHSVSTGWFRMPIDFYKKIVKLYPDEALFARATEVRDGLVALRNSQEDAELQALEHALLAYISPRQYYRCA